jgi:ABC-type branched-subunit amino acid transport system permease subunit
MNSLTFIWAKGRRSPALLAVWGLAAALVIYVLIRGGYLMSVLQIAAIYTVFVTGLNIFMGYTGQVSFGHNAFAAVSGYVSAVLTTTYDWAPLSAAVLGLGGVLLCALIIGYPTLRLRGHYLAMATLAIGLIAESAVGRSLPIAASCFCLSRSQRLVCSRPLASAVRGWGVRSSPSPAARMRREPSASTSRITSSLPF